MVAKVHGFSSGEIDPRLIGRSDLRQYEIGAKKLENMTVNFGGGAKKRPGMKLVALVSPATFDTGATPTSGWGLNWGNSWGE